MPHNLYLHSALVQTRRLGKTVAERREACRFNLFDSVLALNGALIVNAAILVLAAAVFFKHGILVTQIEQAQLLLTPLLGMGLAGSLFAVALLASGQSSTLTGTYAGQIVMEGFLSLRLRPWLRRLVTRAIAIIPAVLTIYYLGDNGTYKLLILSQVILSMQLPFAVIPLIRFTNDSRRMGDFANRAWVRMLAWGSAVLIIALNLWLVATTIGPWMMESAWHALAAGLPIAAVLALLARVTFAGTATPVPKTVSTGAAVAADLPVPHYRSILVPLDHSSHDRAAIAHAAALARSHGATLHLLHVEEGVTSQLFGSLSSTEEIISGEEYFGAIVQSLAASGIAAELTIQHGLTPTNAIVRKAREIHPDLIVMGAHGHRGLKDLIFGNTINTVRHQVDAPVLVVGGVTTPVQ
jgi:manganese transport protein